MFKGVKNFFIKLAKGFTDPNDSSYFSLTGGGTDTPLAGNASDARLLASNKNWVFVCVNKISTTASGIRLMLKKYSTSGDDEEVFENPILNLLYKPNRFQTGKEFFYMTYAHLLLTGNAYWLKDKPNNPKELLPLLPSCVQVKYDSENPSLVKYVYTAPGKAKGTEYPSEMIVHLKEPNPENIFKGKGILAQIAEWVDVDAATTEFNRLFFKNGASPSGTLETEATDEQGLKVAKIGFEMKYQGALNSHKTAILPKGAKYTPSSTPKDMQFTEADQRYRDKILAGFGVPKSVVGIVEDVNRANAESSNYVFMAFTIEPMLRRFIAYLDEVLLPSFTGTQNLYFDIPNIVPENEDLKLRQYQAGLAGQAYLTINEVRAQTGLPPIENGDWVYGGFSTVPIGKPEEEGKKRVDGNMQVKKFRPRFAKVFKKESVTESIFDKAATAIAKITKEVIVSAEEQKHKEFIVRTTPYENKFAAAVKQVDEEMKKMVEDDLDEKTLTGTWAVRKSLINVEKVERLFVSFTMPILQDLTKNEGQAQMEALQVATPFNPMDELMQNRIKNVLKLTAQSYTDTTLKLLNSTLDEGVSNGENMDKLRDRVAEVFKLTDSFRAEQVARTTVFATANASARQAYKQSGVVKTVKWHTAEDELTCEFCEPMNGKTVDVDDTFFEKGDKVRGRDGGVLGVGFMDVEDPPLHPNCRCFTLAENIVIEDDIAPEATKDEETAMLEKIIETLKDDDEE